MPMKGYVSVSTSDLETKLKRASSLEDFLKENEDNFVSSDFISLLGRLFEERKISKSRLARDSGMSEVYLHQIFSGKRRPSRNRLLCLCIGLQVSLEECQELLRINNSATLYARSRRDALIEYGILHGMNLFEINDKLFEADEETLI